MRPIAFNPMYGAYTAGLLCASGGDQKGSHSLPPKTVLVERLAELERLEPMLPPEWDDVDGGYVTSIRRKGRFRLRLRDLQHYRFSGSLRRLSEKLDTLENDVKTWLGEDLMVRIRAVHILTRSNRQLAKRLFAVLTTLVQAHPNPELFKLEEFGPGRTAYQKKFGALIKAIQKDKSVIFERMAPTVIAANLQSLR